LPLAVGEQRAAAFVEGALQAGDEGERVRCEDVVRDDAGPLRDLDAGCGRTSRHFGQGKSGSDVLRFAPYISALKRRTPFLDPTAALGRLTPVRLSPRTTTGGCR